MFQDLLAELQQSFAGFERGAGVPLPGGAAPTPLVHNLLVNAVW